MMFRYADIEHLRNFYTRRIEKSGRSSRVQKMISVSGRDRLPKLTKQQPGQGILFPAVIGMSGAGFISIS
ncbi:hypothetical protein D3Z60_19550 [Lachnospiraceae bacterium]|jgi:hypothetical protein|nr:hypothetical protein [Lachnospiraceae bacterium]